MRRQHQRLEDSFQSTLWKRTRRFGLPLVRLLGALFLSSLLGSAIISPARAQQKAAERVDSLRQHVSQVGAAYANALRSSGENNAASIRVDQLRDDLREKFTHLVKKATSSDATLAMLDADATATLDAIRAYEKNLSTGPGEATTIWNVFKDSAELQQMRDQTHQRLASLQLDRQKFPPEHVPTALEFRIREVQGWLDGLEIELNRRRTLNEQVRLKPIRGDLTIDEARTQFPEIGAADGSGGEHFQRKLAFQINLRLHHAPQDASLKGIEASILDIKPPDLALNRARGPPTSFQSAEQELRAAHVDEFTAITRRDPVDVARARARAVSYSEWLSLNFGNLPANDRFGFSATSTEHLMRLRNAWRDYLIHLNTERQAHPGDPALELQIKDTEVRIREISAIFDDRLLPRPPTDSPWTRGDVPDQPSSLGEAKRRAFERAWDRQMAHQEITELAHAWNQPSPITPVEIPEAVTRAFQNRVYAEAISLSDAFTETIKLQHDLLIIGRGPDAAEAGKQLLQARENIRSAAADLLDVLSDRQLGAFPESETAKTLLRKFALKSGPSPPVRYSQALVTLEQANAIVKVATQRPAFEIHAVSSDGMTLGSENRIKLKPKGLLPPDLPGIKPPTEYNELYQKKGPANTLIEFLKNPKRAPGGIIVDASLPDDIARRIQSLSLDLTTGLLKAKIADSWLPVRLAPDPVLARLAWAFAADERSTVIDLRPLEPEEAIWLVLQYGVSETSPTAMRNSVIQELQTLISVNVNDALRDTPLVPQLIAADQLMFDLLPQQAIRVERENKWPGLSLSELRAAFQTDAGAELKQLESQAILSKKSIIAISNTSYEIGAELIITPQFSFHLFGIPSQGNGILPLKACEQWFNAHQLELRQLPQLAKLSDFAALVTLFRAVQKQGVQTNLEELVAVPVPAFAGPRFIVRKDQVNSQHWQQLRDSLSGKEN